MNLSRNIPLILSNAARLEEEGLPAGAFSSRYSKYHRYGLLIACVVSTCISAIIGFVAKEWDIAMLIFALAVACLLLLVTVISYRCYVDNSVLREYYLILFFKIEREVLWADLKYYSKRTDVSRDTYSIRFYDAEKKKRISFDNGVVGFGRIVKMAKRKKMRRLES